MTENRPIIIDGVDVSKCEQITYKDSLNPMCGNTSICCYGRENCYFKQLAYKTQECEKLKETIQIQNKMQMEVCEEKNTELDQLKAENEKYKKHNEALLKWNENLMTTIKINNQEIKQAEQKLEKIRELAIVLKNICPHITIEGNDSERAINEILQIIDEVK